jgi:hypothetical protein
VTHHSPHLLVAALLLAAATGSIGCEAAPRAPQDPAKPTESPPPKTPKTTKTDKIPEGASRVALRPLPATGPMSLHGLDEPGRLVIRDDASWGNVWSQLVDGTSPAPAVPAIDFARDVVIIAAMGARSSGGYAIGIDEVRSLAGNAWISVTEQSPGERCVVTEAFTFPIAIAVVPRFAGDAVFIEHASQHDCR